MGNPILLLFLGCLVLISFFLLFHFAAQSNKIASFLQRGFTLLFLFCSPSLTQPPFNYLHPVQIAKQPHKNILNLMPLFFYPLVMIVLLSKFNKFNKKSIALGSIVLRKNWGFGLYILLPLISSAWSLAPRATLEFGIAMSITTFFSIYIACQYNWIELSGFMRWSYVLIGIVSYITNPPSSGDWVGVTYSKNALGGILTLSTAFWFLNYSQAKQGKFKRMLSLLMVFISFFMVRTGKSAGALIGCIILIGALLSLRFVKKLNFRWALTCIVLMTVLNICIALVVIENLEGIFTALEKDMTLTGRTIIWPLILREIYKSPVLGYGYSGFWQNWRGDESPGMVVMTENGWSPPNAHNGLIEIFLAFGLIGLILFSISLIMNITNAVHYLIEENLESSGIPIMLIMYLVLNNFTESTITSNNHIWVAYVIMTVRLCLDSVENNRRKLKTKLSSSVE